MTAPLARASDGSYERNGRTYDGVTSVLGVALSKPGLPRWAANETAKAAAEWVRDTPPELIARDLDDVAQKSWASAPWRASSRAAHKGSAVHDIAARLAQGETIAPEAVPTEVAPYLGVLARFLKEWRVKLQCAEATVYHDGEGYAGTLDGLGWIRAPGETTRRGVLAVLDYKSKPDAGKARVYPENRLQLAAYARAQYAAFPDGTTRPVRAKWGAVVLLWPDGYRVERFAIGAADWQAWKAALALYRWHRAQGNGGAK